MSSESKWKEFLLRSGLPLEVSGARLLAARGCFVVGEHEFVVVQSDGTRTHRSVDLLTWWSLPVVNLTLVIECKYRRDGTRWVFVPASHGDTSKRDWFTNCIVAPFVPPWYSDSEMVLPPVVKFAYNPRSTDAGILPIASKGVQITEGAQGSDKRRDNAIREPFVPMRTRIEIRTAREDPEIAC